MRHSIGFACTLAFPTLVLGCGGGNESMGNAGEDGAPSPAEVAPMTPQPGEGDSAAVEFPGTATDVGPASATTAGTSIDVEPASATDTGNPAEATTEPADPADDTQGAATDPQGAAEDGAAEDGAAEDGAAEDGAAEDGAAEDGAAEDGAAAPAEEIPVEDAQPDDEFAGGTRFVLPQEVITSLWFGTDHPTIAGDDSVEQVGQMRIVDGPTYPREYEARFGVSLLNPESCQGYLLGQLEVESVEVHEDLGGTGAHLLIAASDDHYTMTHDGPGRHEVVVTGVFVVDVSALPDPTAHLCPELAGDSDRVPVSFTTQITIEPLTALVMELPQICGAEPAVLSGRPMRDGTRLYFVDSAGQQFSAANAYSEHPIDITVETELEAELEDPQEGLFWDSFALSGPPQKVRLSTALGILATYRLVDLGSIDGWDVDFWSAETQYFKSPAYPIAMDGNNAAVATGRVLGAQARMKVGELELCSDIFATDFEIVRPTPEICDAEYSFSQDPSPGVPGFLASFLGEGGSCEVELAFPGGNGGAGLSTQFLASWAQE